MKTRTAISDISASTQQDGRLVIPGRLARTGIAALALTAAGMGFLGAGGASADGPRMIGRVVNTQVTQSAQIKVIQTAGTGHFGKVTTSKVMLAKVSSKGTGEDGKSCSAEADLVNESLLASDLAAADGEWEFSFDLAKQADVRAEDAVDNGCILIWE